MSEPIRAIAVFQSRKIKGTVHFTEDSAKQSVLIDIHITGLKINGKHGFHIHECGDMSEQCESMCAHFNPYNKSHGGADSAVRHVGDLGNLISDKNGVAHYQMHDSKIALRGAKCNIIGRGLIIHQDEDDCGLGANAESLVTGNAGKRIACAVIGYSSKKNRSII